MELQGKKFNFLGDSITYGYGLASEEDVFFRVLARKTGIIARGYGVSGTRIARQDEDYDRPGYASDFVARMETMDKDADGIVVFGGTNDFGHGAAPLGSREDFTPYTFYGALRVLCDGLIRRYPTAQIVFLSPLHRVSEDATVKEICGLPEETNLAGYAEILKEVCRDYSLPVLDLFAVAGIQPKIEEQRLAFMPDGLHPNAAGHARIAEKLEAFLRAL